MQTKRRTIILFLIEYSRCFFGIPGVSFQGPPPFQKYLGIPFNIFSK